MFQVTKHDPVVAGKLGDCGDAGFVITPFELLLVGLWPMRLNKSDRVNCIIIATCHGRVGMHFINSHVSISTGSCVAMRDCMSASFVAAKTAAMSIVTK